mgnify:CR=1 FL=1
MDLSIIIVNYKSQTKLANCLLSLQKVDFDDIDHEIIVVENNSGDQLESLLAAYPKVRLLISERNLGMGGGNNLGIKHSRGKFILIANPDLVFSPSSIKELYIYLQAHPEAAVVAPQLLNPDGSLQYSCARFPSIFLPVLRRTSLGRYLPALVDRYLMRHEDHRASRAVDWILGACFLVRRDELFQFGNLFDERFFMYFEDVDLCRRAQQLGKKVIYHPVAQVTHDHMRDSARLPWYQAIFSDRLARIHLQSWWKYFKKWGWR